MRELPLRDVLRFDRAPVSLKPDEKYATAGILSYGRGLFERPVIKGSETSYGTYFRLRKDQFVYSKLFAWEGALAVVDARFDGLYVSQEFPTFAIDEQRAIPPYLTLLSSWPETWARVRAGETGMGGRRKRVHPERLLDVVLPFPSIPEQRRIVDLVAAVDRAITASSHQRAVAVEAADVLREDGLADLASSPLSELLVSIEAGKSPAAEDRAPEPDDLAVLKVSAVRRGWFDASQVKVLASADGFPPRAVLRDGDLLMTRANTRELVGLVCRVEHAPRGWFLCDKTLRLNPRLELASHDYLLEALLSDFVRRQIEEAATGTSESMKNISQATISGLQVPLMPRDRQVEWTAMLAEARRVVQSSSQVTTQLLALRTALMSELMSGDHTIPSSYDDLMVPT